MKDLLAENDKTVHGMARDKRSKKEAETRYPKSMKTSTCKNSGRKQGVKEACPAQGELCFKCNKPNHSRMCDGSEAVHECDEVIHQSNFEDGDLFIEVVKNEGNEVLVKLVIENSHAVKVKLGIQGAQVHVMLITIYKTRESWDPQDFKPTNGILTAFRGNKIDVLDRCQLKCRYKNIVCV